MGIQFEQLLNEKQREACCSSARHLRIVAGAGTGKTRVLTYRIAYLITQAQIPPSRIVAITFTNKVAKEMKERVEKIMENNQTPLLKYKPLIATFHGYCYRFLRRECQRLESFNTKFTVADEDMVKDIFKKVFDIMRFPNDKDMRSYVVSMIGGLKSKGVFVDEVSEGDLPPFGHAKPSEVVKAYHLYQELLRKNDAMDFDDLLMYTVEILKRFPEVRSRWQRKFFAYLIDEFQDTNQLQYDLVKLLLSPEALLTVVGDPDQTIYTWRGADSELIQRSLPKDFPDLSTVTLDLNYRSTQQILDKANLLIAFNRNRLEKNLTAYNDQAGPDVSFTPCSSNKMEAAVVTNQILDLRRKGVPFKDVALIYRSNYLSQPFEQLFSQNRIPYAVYGDMKFFDRKEVKDAIAYLRLLVNPQDDYSFTRVLKAPSRGIGEGAYELLERKAKELEKGVFQACVENLDELPMKPAVRQRMVDFRTVYWKYASQVLEAEPSDLKDLIDRYLIDVGFIRYVNEVDTKEDKKSFDSNDAQTRLKNVRALIDLFASFLETPSFDEDGKEIAPSLEEFLINVALQSAQDRVTDGDRVAVMTAHVSKGLEFPYVFVVGLDQGIFPTGHAIQKGPGAIEEERRLCYVAMTRAQKQLFLSSQGGYSYAFGGYAVPSQFVREAGFEQSASSEEERSSYVGGGGRGYLPRAASKGYSHYDGYFSAKGEQAIKPSPKLIEKAVIPQGFSSNTADVYEVGDKVAHLSFGVGEVTGVDGSVLTVKFEEPFGVKRLMKGFKAFRKV